MRLIISLLFIFFLPLFFTSCLNTAPSKPDEKKAATIELITKLDSGMTYKILKPGTGTETPKAGQKVTVHYAGWLDDNGKLGKKFDSSVDRGQKFTASAK